jgi:hypothetical protein
MTAINRLFLNVISPQEVGSDSISKPFIGGKTSGITENIKH